MAINYEDLHSAMHDQTSRWSYTRNQIESPYLRKRAQDMANTKVKIAKKAEKEKKRNPSPPSPEGGHPTPPPHGLSREELGKALKAKYGRKREVKDLSAYDKRPGRSQVSPPLKSSLKPSGNPFSGSHASPVNFRDQSTAGLHFDRTPERPRSPFARPGEVTNPKGKSSFLERSYAKGVEAQAELRGKRFLGPSAHSEAMSSARGVTHSTGESWAGRTGKKLLQKAEEIGTQRAIRKNRSERMAQRAATGAARRAAGQTPPSSGNGHGGRSI